MTKSTANIFGRQAKAAIRAIAQHAALSAKALSRCCTVFAILAFCFVSADVSSLTVSSSSDDGNMDINTLDGDLNTRWSAQGHGQWIEYDMEAIYELVGVDIAFYRGNERTAEFAIQASIDGEHWQVLWHGTQTVMSDTMQSFQTESGFVSARFVRIVGYGNSENDWISLSEVGIDVRKPVHAQLNDLGVIGGIALPGYASSVNHQDSSVLDALDGDLDTYWSAKGLGQWLAFDLGQVQHISSIDMAFFKGDQRVSTFEIETSADGISWSRVFSGQQTTLTTQLQNMNINDSFGRFVKIRAFGNSQNDWFTLSEISINSNSFSF